MHLRTASVADRDIVDCALWLDQQQTGMGDDFVKAVQETFTENLQMPLACPTLNIFGSSLRSELRWLGIGKFAHVIIFTVQGEEITVVAVVHPHRDLESVLRSRVGSS